MGGRRMGIKISMRDFRFATAGYGHIKVTYISPVTGKRWSKTINNTSLLDETLYSENPKKKDLVRLKKECKGRVIV